SGADDYLTAYGFEYNFIEEAIVDDMPAQHNGLQAGHEEWVDNEVMSDDSGYGDETTTGPALSQQINDEAQGFFDIPVENLRASPFLLQYIRENISDYKNAIIVARYPGAVRKATAYAERLRVGIAVIHGEHKEAETDEVDGRTSPPPALSDSSATEAASVGASVGMGSTSTDRYNWDGLPQLLPKEKPPITIVGDVGGRIAIMIDDVIDDVESFVSTAEHLRDHGAYKIYVLATHGFFSADAPALIEDSPIDEVIVTNTVPHELQKMRCHKIKTIDISILLAEAMRRIQNKESLSFLFKNVSLED
ncbi:unnamed protein product, partial [Medioppia subpectinata]